VHGKKDTAEFLSIEGTRSPHHQSGQAVFSRDVKLSKLDVVRYYLSVASGAVTGIRDRPIVLKRFVDGAEKEPFYRSARRRIVRLAENSHTLVSFRAHCRGNRCRRRCRTCMDRQPRLHRAASARVSTNDLDHPDELRIDLDPIPGVEWDDVRRVAMEAKNLLEELGLRGWPKTSGSRGMHVNARIHSDGPSLK
jgi:DNA primase